jgi:hypothetical protein
MDAVEKAESQFGGGGGGIRTHGTVSRTTVFKTVALNHSATPPSASQCEKLAKKASENGAGCAPDLSPHFCLPVATFF